MGRPGLNKNEGIRINIEQRYFLEDRFSKQGKLKVSRREGGNEKFSLILYSEVWFHLHVTQFISRGLSQLALHCAARAHLPLCGSRARSHAGYYFNCLFTAAVRQKECSVFLCYIIHGLAQRLGSLLGTGLFCLESPVAWALSTPTSHTINS